MTTTLSAPGGPGGFTFPFDPDAFTWRYSQKTTSQDTLGGRVVQLLGISITGLTLQTHLRSREEFHRFIRFVRDLIAWQTDDLEEKRTARLFYSKRNWSFSVYVQSLNISDSLENVTFPVSLTFAVAEDEDLTPVLSELKTEALTKIQDGVGYVAENYSSPETDYNKEHTDEALHYEYDESANNGASGGSATATGSAASIIEFARNAIGTPYVWGGESSAGYDCSGLTQASYRSQGKTLPRTAAQQYQATTSAKIPYSQAQPGDLLFWGGSGGVYHVAIYTGNGRMIHAPVPGDVVKEVPVYFSNMMPYVGRM